LESILKDTSPNAIPGQKLSQALKPHHQLAVLVFPKKKRIKGFYSHKSQNPNGTLAGEWITFTNKI
jgi:hypothetical protein